MKYPEFSKLISVVDSEVLASKESKSMFSLQLQMTYKEAQSLLDEMDKINSLMRAFCSPSPGSTVMKES